MFSLPSLSTVLLSSELELQCHSYWALVEVLITKELMSLCYSKILLGLFRGVGGVVGFYLIIFLGGRGLVCEHSDEIIVDSDAFCFLICLFVTLSCLSVVSLPLK